MAPGPGREKSRRIGTTPLLVVWFAGTVQPGWLDHSTWPVAGRWFVRLERIAFCAIGGSAFSALRRSCSSRTSRSTGTLVPGWIGFRGVGGVWQLGQGRVEPARSRTGRAVADGRSTNVSVRLERIDVALVRGSTGGWRCLEAVRWSWSGPKSRHRKSFKSCEHSGPSAAPLDSRSVDGLDRSRPFYSGTPLKERIDGPVESLSRLNGHVAAAVGVSGSVA